MSETVRLDKWLWAARFFRTRSLATEQIGAGHVRLNGVMPKPSAKVRIGDKLHILRGQVEYTLRITAVAEKRGSAGIASGLYRETQDSIAARKEQAEEHRLCHTSAPAPERRPDKKARRQIIRFHQRSD